MPRDDRDRRLDGARTGAVTGSPPMLASLIVVLALAACAKQPTSGSQPAPGASPPAAPPPSVVESPPPAAPPAVTPLVIVRELEEELPGGKRSVKLVLRGEEDDAAVTRLLTDYVDANRREGEELWVAVFFEGMDLQSIEFAFAVAKPGRRPYITVRESLQTYR